MTDLKRTLCIIVAAAIPTIAMTQKLFTLDDLIPGGSTYYQSSFPQNRYTTWWGDRCVHLDLEQCSEIDPLTGKETPLITLAAANKALTAAGLRPVHHLYNVFFPDEKRTLAVLRQPDMRVIYDWQLNEIVWKQSCGDGSKEPTHEDWNMRSRHLAEVIDHNLYVVTANGERRTLSTDGSLDLTFGESVHRDEFGIEKGTFWSPSGEKLAFYRMDQSMVSSYPQVNVSPTATDASRIAVMDPEKYPMTGETSHQVSVGIYDVATGKTVYLQTGDPTDRYFTNIQWSPDERTLYLIELNRDQNHATLDTYDVATGQKTATILTEDNEKYVEPTHPIEFLPWDQSRFIYQTRNRDGYNHLYLCDGKSVKPLTKGAFEVIDLLGFNRETKSIIYTSNEADPIGCTIYSVDLKGRRKLIGNANGWHTALLSASGKYVFDNWNWGGEPDCGRHLDLIDTRSGRSTEWFRAPEPWQAFRVPEMRVGTLKAADGVTDLYYRITLPTDFDPSKRYPAIVYVYGGPHAHNVDASRHYGVRGWDIWMAQKGYVLFSIDNRGSEHRGLAFEQATFRQLGTEEMKDQMKGVDYLKSLPYVDSNRIGVHGWSFGGFMTTSLMTTYPDVFRVGVAGGPVIDWKYYEIMYGERYMDTPQSNPDGYAKASLLNKADKLKGRLLIIYGGNDPVCVPQHTLSFIRACIDAGTHPDLFTYPGDGHNMMGTDRVHLHEHISRYFDDYLKN